MKVTIATLNRAIARLKQDNKALKEALKAAQKK
jgi:outer membrane murein-binding lipoprotein Lpp